MDAGSFCEIEMMPKIGIDARLLYYRDGGTGVYIRQLLAHLARLDTQTRYEVVHHFRYRHTLKPASNFRRVDTLTPSHHRLERWTLGLELSRLGLDVYHATDFIPPHFGARRFVITVHDLNFLHFPQFHTADSLCYYTGQIQAAVQKADAILAVSEHTKQDLITRLGVPADKIIVQGQGVAETYKPRKKAEIQPVLAQYGLTEGYLLHVGTLEPRKNLPMLLKAYHELRQVMPDTPPLVLVGRRGWLFEAIFHTMSELDLQAHVKLLEDVPTADLPAIYNGASLLALVSHYEGFGMPVAEAMACGVPCVVSAVSSLPEVAGDAALLCSPNRADEIAHALQRLLTDFTLREQLIQLGYEQAKRFTWEQVTKQVLSAYQLALV